jgi:hypothetical protein
MGKFYAYCNISGHIRFTDEQPGERQFALAVGEFSLLSGEITKTALVSEHRQELAIMYRVPGTRDGADPRTNLTAIAQYIQMLAARETPGVRAMGA